MIHFDFIVSDEDAENIFSAVRDQAARFDDLILQTISTNMSESQKDQILSVLRSHRQYYNDLPGKMTNQRVKE